MTCIMYYIQLARDLGGNQWVEYDRAFREWAAAKKLRVWRTQSTNLLPVSGHSTEISTPASRVIQAP